MHEVLVLMLCGMAVGTCMAVGYEWAYAWCGAVAWAPATVGQMELVIQTRFVDDAGNVRLGPARRVVVDSAPAAANAYGHMAREWPERGWAVGYDRYNPTRWATTDDCDYDGGSGAGYARYTHRMATAWVVAGVLLATCTAWHWLPRRRRLRRAPPLLLVAVRRPQ